MDTPHQLGFGNVFCIAAGAMISSGLFVLPGLAYAQTGPGMILAYALAALMVIPAVLSQAELTSAMPQSGGTYVFVEKSLGTLAGAFAGAAVWFALALKSAFALIGIGALTQLVRPDSGYWTIKLTAMGFCLFFILLNCLSVKGVGRFQVALVAGLLGVLTLFIGGGLPHIDHRHFAGFLSAGAQPLFATAGLVFISYGGLTEVASIAGEVRNPARTIPLGMLSALGVVSLVYVAAVFVTVGVTRADQLPGHLAPLSLAASTFLGPVGSGLLALAAALAYITTANGGILEASRSPMAMSRDGLLPAFPQRISRRFGAPYASILLTGGFMLTVIAALSLEALVKAASTMMLVLYLLVNLAVVIMRTSRIQNYRPVFKTPLYPLPQVVGMVCYAMLVLEMGVMPIVVTTGFAALCVLWWLLYVRPRTERESALVYMVRRVVGKDMYRPDLEDELKEIALQRDQIVHDTFDHLVKECPILDLPESVSAEEFFRLAGEALAGPTGQRPAELAARLSAREQESSTVIQPGLAIPHVIVPGQEIFAIVMARARKGILFPGQSQPVQTAFALAGSSDRRNFHLRALMAIAHIVQEHGFMDRWLGAPQPEHLRDILLLSRRQRHD